MPLIQEIIAPFGAADVDRAADEWGCNCGPAALAAILGKTLEEVRPHLGQRQNHWLDTLVLACVGAHLCGARIVKEETATAPAVERKTKLMMPDGRPYLVTERKQ